MTSARQAITIRLFGPVRIELGGVVKPLRAAPKAIELLGYLAVRNAPVARDALASLLWPDVAVEDARANLRRQLHVLTRALPPSAAPYVLATPTSLQWNPSAPATVDTLAFRTALQPDGDGDAIVWYAGDFLDGTYAEWIVAEREKLRSECVDALFARIRCRRGENDLRAALADATRLLEIDPWREDVVRIELVLRNRLGDRSGALAAYRTFAARLARELETEPMPETHALYDLLMRGDAIESEAVPAPASPLESSRGLPLHGRDAERHLLNEAWTSAARGSATLALVGGEAGIGKSRLAQELALHVESQGGRAFVGTTSPGEARPHEAIVEALRAALPLIESTIRDRSVFTALAPLLPELEARHGLADAMAIGPAAARVRLFDALATTLETLAAARPMTIVLEDLHWAGAPSLDLLSFLMRRLERSRVLIVGTYREEEVRGSHPLRAMRRQLEAEVPVRTIALERLDATAVERIVRETLGDGLGAALPETVARVIALADGLPLFLDEAIREPNRPLDGERLNVFGRIAALPDESRSLVEIAAVAGVGFDVDLLCEATGWPESSVVRALGPLVASRLVREPYRRTRSDYVFSHHLIAAAVYDGIAEADRRRRHERMAESLIVLAGDRIGERSADVAKHFDRCGRSDDAATWYAVAARSAAAIFASEAALEYAALCIAATTNGRLAAEMRTLRIDVAFGTYRTDIIDTELDELARAELTDIERAKFERHRSRQHRHRFEFEQAVACAKRSLALSETATGRKYAEALVELAEVALFLGRYDDARRYADEVDSLAADAANGLEEGFGRGLQSMIAMRVGDFERMLAISETGERRARELGAIFPEAVALFYRGVAYENLNRFDEAEGAYARSRALYLRCDNQRAIVSLDVNLGSLLNNRADYPEALDWNRRLDETLLRLTKLNLQTGSVARLNWAYSAICLGDLHDARATLDRFPPADGSESEETACWWLFDGLQHWLSGRLSDAGASIARAAAFRRGHGHAAQLALAAGFGAIVAHRAGEEGSALAYAREIAALPAERLRESDNPHVGLWAIAATTAAPGRRTAYEAAERLRAERASLLGNQKRRDRWDAVPWNALFLRELALERNC